MLVNLLAFPFILMAVPQLEVYSLVSDMFAHFLHLFLDSHVTSVGESYF